MPPPYHCCCICSKQRKQKVQLPLLRLLLFATQAAMQAAPGSLFISIYEAGSTDATTYWLDVLRLLLLPLRVPAAITTGGSIPARCGCRLFMVVKLLFAAGSSVAAYICSKWCIALGVSNRMQAGIR